MCGGGLDGLCRRWAFLSVSAGFVYSSLVRPETGGFPRRFQGKVYRSLQIIEYLRMRFSSLGLGRWHVVVMVPVAPGGGCSFRLCLRYGFPRRSGHVPYGPWWGQDP